MVDFSSPSPMFIPIVFILEDKIDTLEDRESEDYYIIEGNLSLECNEIGAHPMIDLL